MYVFVAMRRGVRIPSVLLIGDYMKKRHRKKNPNFRIEKPLKHVVGFSGGIDSQACARWVLNRYPPEDVILLNSDVGGHEHPITTQFIADYSRDVHPVEVITPIVADMRGRKKGRIEELGLKPNDPLTFEQLGLIVGMWPSSKFQFCTEFLKLAPSHRWIEENIRGKGYKWVRYAGVRREESRRRQSKKAIEWDDYFGCELHHPIMDWTKQMCFDYVKYHGEQVNELYTLGFNRVGCAPCINSNKQDIRAWARRFPEMIDKVRNWEKSVGIPFFKPKWKDGKKMFIDDIVEWSMTKHGGREFDLEVLKEPPSCESQYGICE